MAIVRTEVDALSIFISAIRQVTFTDKNLGERIKAQAELIYKDLTELNYKPTPEIINEAKELAAILITSITGSDRLTLVVPDRQSNVDEEEDEDKTGSRISARNNDDEDDEE